GVAVHPRHAGPRHGALLGLGLDETGPRPADAQPSQHRDAHRPQPLARTRRSRSRRAQQRLHGGGDPGDAPPGGRLLRDAGRHGVVPRRRSRAPGGEELTAVGFVGLGQMGLPMARLLVEAGPGGPGYDASAGARAAFGGIDTVQGAAHAETVILMLPSTAVVEQVLLEDGLLETVASGALVVDMGSSEPTSTRRLAEQAAGRGVYLIDAPVSGGVRKAVDGTLTIMAGGPR